MIDLHTHLLFGVDDGAETIEESNRLIKEAIDIGVKTIVLTPHFRKGRFEIEDSLIQQRFYELQSLFPEVTLLLGREIYCQHGIEKDFSDEWTLGDSNAVLLEFRRDITFIEIYNHVLMFINRHYEVVIAHVERYSMLSMDEIERLKAIGCWIQVNANNVASIKWFDKNRYSKQLVKEMIKREIVDVIASDTHNQTSRSNKMAKAYCFVEKMYGKNTAKQLFIENPKRILSNQKKISNFNH